MKNLIKTLCVILLVVLPLFSAFADTKLTFQEAKLIYPEISWEAVAGFTYQILEVGEDCELIEVDGEVYVVQE